MSKLLWTAGDVEASNKIALLIVLQEVQYMENEPYQSYSPGESGDRAEPEYQG
jgi:hypothetical protein